MTKMEIAILSVGLGWAAILFSIMGIVGAVGLFTSIVLHELSHSLVGRHYGVPIAGITLFIFGGIAEMSEDSPNPKSELLMALAGPLFSILLGVIFGLLFKMAKYLLSLASTCQRLKPKYLEDCLEVI